MKDGTHGSFERTTQGIPFLSAKNLVNGRVLITDQDDRISHDDYLAISRNGHLQSGDLLLSIVGTIGKVAIFEQTDPVAFQRSVAMLRFAPGFDTRFYSFFAQSTLFQGHLGASTNRSAQGGVYLSDLARIPLIVPPPEEQCVIASFLDRETAKIDALIKKKERLIELLQEKRTALISHAVTKGLDPNVPMKDSGIPWIGEVPAHWDLINLNHTVTGCQNGIWGSEPTEESHHTIACIRVADFDRARLRIDTTNLTLRSVPPNQRNGRLLNNGDLLIEKSGGGEHQPVGAVMLWDHDIPAVCSNFVAVMPVNQGFNSRYLCYVHFQQYASRLITPHIKQTTGIQNLDSSSYLRSTVAMPPYEEQVQIALHLATVEDRINQLSDKISQQILTLQEHRTALISAAVTGKIDVRGEVQ